MFRDELERYTIGKPSVILQEELRRLCLCREIYKSYYEKEGEKRESERIIEKILKNAKEEGILFSGIIGNILNEKEWASRFNISGKYYEGLNRLALYLINGDSKGEEKLSGEVKAKAYIKSYKNLSKLLEYTYDINEDINENE